MYTLLYCKWIASKDLMWSASNCSMVCGSLGGRGVWGGCGSLGGRGVWGVCGSLGGRGVWGENRYTYTGR